MLLCPRRPLLGLHPNSRVVSAMNCLYTAVVCENTLHSYCFLSIASCREHNAVIFISFLDCQYLNKSHHARVQASGPWLRRRGKICFGELAIQPANRPAKRQS